MLSITTYNASSNDTFINHIIIDMTKDSSRPFKKDNWIRCFAHVINPCVKSCLDVMGVLVQKVTPFSNRSILPLPLNIFCLYCFKLRDLVTFLEEFAQVTTYIEGSEYPTLSLVVPMYNQLLDLLEDVSRDKKKNPLVVQGAAAGLQKLFAYYKSSPLVMAATFMDPRCKMQYFVDHGWNSGGQTTDAFSDLEEDLISARVKPAYVDWTFSLHCELWCLVFCWLILIFNFLSAFRMYGMSTKHRVLSFRQHQATTSLRPVRPRRSLKLTMVTFPKLLLETAHCHNAISPILYLSSCLVSPTCQFLRVSKVGGKLDKCWGILDIANKSAIEWMNNFEKYRGSTLFIVLQFYMKINV